MSLIKYGGVCVLVFLAVVTASITVQQEEDQVAAARGVLTRFAGKEVASKFTLELLDPSSVKEEGERVFEIETIGDKVVLRGTTGVEIASAFNYFLKNYCDSHISWFGNNIQIPSPLPQVSPVKRVVTPFKYSYYFNVCTFGYSTVWWTIERWQREIDWMALNGINMPLAFTGQEIVWQNVYNKLFGWKHSDLDDFFTGPAFLPWQRMGNLDGWMSPLPEDWIHTQRKLQVQILTAERALGMTPVLPAFSGHVPAALVRHFPDVNVTRLDDFDVGFKGALFLDPHEELFAKIGEAFTAEVMELYGTDHLYNTDPFNEMAPSYASIDWLEKVGSTTYNSMRKADPEATWVMQGWVFTFQPDVWTANLTQALLDSVPTEGLIMLDLFAEINPGWPANKTHNWYGRRFIWCMLHNFGGRPGLYGTMRRVNAGPPAALAETTNLVQGVGLTPEGIMTNPIMYDLMNDMGFRSEPIADLDAWVRSYQRRRYGKMVESAAEAWHKLQYTVYDFNGTFWDPESIIVQRPSLTLLDHYYWWEPFYNTSELSAAWTLLFSAHTELAGMHTYEYDLIDVTREVLNSVFYYWYQDFVDAYNATDVEGVKTVGNKLLKICSDLDSLLGTSSDWLLGTWIADARSKAVSGNTEEADYYELNARTQVTLWGHKVSSDDLRDYANKHWNGLVADFYKPRWEQFLELIVKDMEGEATYDAEKFKLHLEDWEEDWTHEKKTYPVTGTGNTVEVVSNIHKHYAPQLPWNSETERLFSSYVDTTTLPWAKVSRRHSRVAHAQQQRF